MNTPGRLTLRRPGVFVCRGPSGSRKALHKAADCFVACPFGVFSRGRMARCSICAPIALNVSSFPKIAVDARFRSARAPQRPPPSRVTGSGLTGRGRARTGFRTMRDELEHAGTPATKGAPGG
jgi:hypothetical protein